VARGHPSSQISSEAITTVARRRRPDRCDRRFCDAWNQRCHPFVWVKDADDVLVKATPSAQTIRERYQRRYIPGQRLPLSTQPCCGSRPA
jgi:hypothetical protein